MWTNGIEIKEGKESEANEKPPHMGESLWRWAVHEFDPLLDAAF